MTAFTADDVERVTDATREAWGDMPEAFLEWLLGGLLESGAIASIDGNGTYRLTGKGTAAIAALSYLDEDGPII